MNPAYVTPADPSLPHQVVFRTMNNRAYMSCNCLRNSRGHKLIGKTDGDLDLARELYNDPTNHRGTFTQEDEAKW